MSDILNLREFGVAFGSRVVLSSVDLDVASTGVTAILGPGGAGKSTLVRTLAGVNRNQPALKTWGNATFDGQPLGSRRHPAIVVQNLCLLTASVRENAVFHLPHRGSLTVADQRRFLSKLFLDLGAPWLSESLDSNIMQLSLADRRIVAIVGAYTSGSPLLCVDEPEFGLSEGDAAAVLHVLKRIAETCAVIWVTHNRDLAKAHSGTAALLAGGRIIECAPASTFFQHPSREETTAFLATGGSPIPGPMATADDLAEGTPLPPPLPVAAQQAIRGQRPSSFYWLYRGVLGGVQRPGIMGELDDDLRDLQKLGVTILVTLEETPTVSEQDLQRFGIKAHFFPISDMSVPATSAALSFCEQVQEWIGDGEVVVYHCRAGMGRTGTMLACWLIWRGATALEALESARAVNARWIQSQRQIEFLSEFWRVCQHLGRQAPLGKLDEIESILGEQQWR